MLKVEDDGLQQQLVVLQQAVEAAAEQSSPNLEPASKTRRPAMTTTAVAGIIIVTQCINLSTASYYVLAFYQNTTGWTFTGCQTCKAKWKYHLCILTLVKFL